MLLLLLLLLLKARPLLTFLGCFPPKVLPLQCPHRLGLSYHGGGGGGGGGGAEGQLKLSRPVQAARVGYHYCQWHIPLVEAMRLKTSLLSQHPWNLSLSN